ncbi:MAG: helix-turn-helix domain-containing protein [Lutibacter sp.]|uniref:helix-turn-helix domain-containing protein n=1 Tax=Lutibacter sp. TaxID=1925666 RepID=UPI0019EF6ABE|nr:helix-turn-helix transcriptional regulator [Lutibacter sp.]NOR28490.1 helix-turn-helix domain-containing protein [Lutibacter sp.]
MVNIEGFSKRLVIIMNYYDLSAASLAEKINVQRSSISHLLSGRNKPSLDFVLKILKAFPEVELYWLLNGSGEFPKKEKQLEQTPTLFSIKEQNSTNENTSKIIEKSAQEGEIERIVIFYKDGTFKNYNP